MCCFREKVFAASGLLEMDLLAVWLRRKEMLFFFTTYHGRPRIIDRVYTARQLTLMAAAALEEGYIRRMLARERLWQRHCNEKREHESGCVVTTSISSSCSSGGGSDDFAVAAVVVVNSAQHERNMSETFNRWQIYGHIFSFL